MQALESSLKTLLQALPRPTDKQSLDALVSDVISKTKGGLATENWKNQWEYLLRNEIFTLAATEGDALKNTQSSYYDDLRDRLDLVLTFTEHDACEQGFPFNVLYDLLETQTIASCAHIFSWIEERADRLTEGMVPQKGKALVLLRTLNDLLRRLSKTGSTTMFCGRILTFLSRVFPLGERSGVNLRGEYGPVWEGPGVNEKGEKKGEAGEVKPGQEDADKMQVDEAKADDAKSLDKKREQKEEFYTHILVAATPLPRPAFVRRPATFPSFKEAVNKVLPVIKEATAKDRALMGSKSVNNGTVSTASLKRKREPTTITDSGSREYFFAKYLTSPELLDLEIADTHFRRQFLFQLLILLNHLLTFTKSVKATWSSPRNRSLQIDFTLEAADAQWVHETIAKATEELRQTAPTGRAFAETVHVILEREKNWVRWKNELCAPFDREPWAEEIDGRKVGLEEATVEVRKKMRVDPPEWEHPYGAGDVKDFTKKVKQEDARIQMRQKQLERTAERLAEARAKAAAQKEASNAATLQAAGSSSSIASNSTSATLAGSGSQDTLMASGSSTNSLQPPPRTPAPPLHPSLPAKPGTIPPSTSHDVAMSSPVRVPTPNPPPPAPPVEPAKVVLPPDEQIAKYEENKQRWSWLALRTARDQYLQHFGKIGAGDVVLLLQEIEKEKQERERIQAASATGSGDELGASPAVNVNGPAGKPASATKPEEDGQNGSKDTEGDVKMDER
ncbi:THO complex subunit 1 [Grifola frondosa]|uniref:THO complex subunit 1 n=1 Tax=Grifola frondosa TaxID=5627 RepID=A0A1C7LV66_GRIFR|nr:THO complex subunit 1 [Grifola frondosa]